MKVKIAALLTLIVCASCTQKIPDFEMTVETVDALNGLILKGSSITGKVQKGCIANDDEYVISRKGKEILKTTTRILNVEIINSDQEFDGKVQQGDVVTFYLPEVKADEILVGDSVTSMKVSCQKNNETLAGN